MIQRSRSAALRFGTLVVCALITSLCAASGSSAQEIDLPRLQEQYQSLAKSATSQYANEKQLQAALRELRALDAQIKKQLPDDLANEEDNPVVKLHSQVVVAIANAAARLPVEPVEGGGRNTALRVPSYHHETLVGKAAERVRAAQGKLTAALRQASGSEQASNALAELILAQESLAWEVGWPYTEAEAKAAQEAKELPPRVYQQRRTRGLRIINRHLKSETAGVGRDDPHPFEIFRTDDEETQKKVRQRLSELRGAAAAEEWATGTRPVDEKTLIQLLQVR